MNKIAVLSLSFILTLGMLAGCAKTTAPETLKIGSMPTQTASIYAVGLEKGIFKKHQIDLKMTIFNSAIERDAAATAGELDGFLTDIMGTVNLKAHDFNYKITSSEYENFRMMLNEQSANNPSLKIGVANNTVTEYIADTLDSGKTIEKVNVPKVPERLAAVISNALNGGVFPEPFVSIIQSKKGTVLLSSAEENLQPVVFVFNEAYLKDRKDAVKRFYSAYNETVAYMKSTDYSDYKDILIQYKIVTPELADLIKLPLEQYGDAKQVTPEDLENVQNWMIDKKMIQAPYPDSELTEAGIY